MPQKYTAGEREFHFTSQAERLTHLRAEGVTHVQLMTARNSGVCDQCAQLDGKVFPIDDAPRLPLHEETEETWYICRCMYSPVTSPQK